jgi:hypothetical protein
MEDLAPDIVRQRLLIEGFYELDIDAAVIESYFGARAVQLTAAFFRMSRSSVREF